MTKTSAPDETMKRKRGRPRGAKGKPRAPSAIPRLGLRVNELAVAIGTSRANIKNAIGRGEIKTLWVGGCEIVPQPELKRLGFVEAEKSESKVATDVKR